MTDAWRWMLPSLGLRVLRRMLWALLTALVLVQTLGVLHRVVHAPSRAHVERTDAVGARDKSHTWTRVWGQHSSLTDCQFFDQACPDVLHVALSDAVTLTVPQGWQVFSWHSHRALFERFYAARGPPALY